MATQNDWAQFYTLLGSLGDLTYKLASESGYKLDRIPYVKPMTDDDGTIHTYDQEESSMVQCSSCSHMVSNMASFCPFCGAAMAKPDNGQRFCMACGKPVKLGAKFCSTCGEPLPVKPSAIVAKTDAKTDAKPSEPRWYNAASADDKPSANVPKESQPVTLDLLPPDRSVDMGKGISIVGYDKVTGDIILRVNMSPERGEKIKNTERTNWPDTARRCATTYHINPNTQRANKGVKLGDHRLTLDMVYNP